MEFSDLYEEYKKQFLANLATLHSLDPRKDHKQYEKLIKETDLLLKHISIEMFSISKGQSANQIRQVLKPHKDQFLRIKKNWESDTRRFLAQVQSNQNLCMEESDQNQKLSECKKLLYGMEETSNQINENLSKQSEKMHGMKGKVQSINTVLSSANTLLTRMTNRENMRGNVTTFILVGVFLIVGVLKFCCY